VASAAAAAVAVATPKPPRIDPATGEELPPRKRRRRRRGKPVDGAGTAESDPQAAPANATPRADRGPREVRPTRTQPHSPRAKAELDAAQSAPADARPGLMSRVARGLKALVTRAPRNQH
jgi:ATP-dependent RNA helicase RhlB